MKQRYYRRFSDVEGIEYKSEFLGDPTTLPGYGAKPSDIGWYRAEGHLPGTYDSSASPAQSHSFENWGNSLEEHYQSVGGFGIAWVPRLLR